MDASSTPNPSNNMLPLRCERPRRVAEGNLIVQLSLIPATFVMSWGENVPASDEASEPRRRGRSSSSVTASPPSQKLRALTRLWTAPMGERVVRSRHHTQRLGREQGRRKLDREKGRERSMEPLSLHLCVSIPKEKRLT